MERDDKAMPARRGDVFLECGVKGGNLSPTCGRQFAAQLADDSAGFSPARVTCRRFS
jgi:hypothetical protein